MGFRIRMLGLLMVLTGCHHTVPQTAPKDVQETLLTHRPVSFFSGVDVRVPVDVTLSTHPGPTRVLLHGARHDLALIQTEVRHGTLYVTSAHGHWRKAHRKGPVHVEIQTPVLEHLVYIGRGDVHGYDLKSAALDVMIRNTKQTVLTGRMGLHHLSVYGRGHTRIESIASNHLQVQLFGRPMVKLKGQVSRLDLEASGSPQLILYWLNGPHVTVKARGQGGLIQLAGVTHRLDVELWGGAHFNGRYLRAKNTFVKTHQHAVASIVTTLNQHTLAMDASDIHAYTLPQTTTDFMTKNGAELDMRDALLQLEQPFDAYNRTQ